MLSDVEVRVLGALIEKEITTPDSYPLSLNSLLLACNQTSNRSPITHLDEATVADAAEILRMKKLVSRIERGESRVIKYRHTAYETMNWGRPAIAIMDVLMLRGPQTLGEIRTRSARLFDFTGLDEVEIALNALTTGHDGNAPFVVQLPRQPGQKEVRFAHLLSGEVDFTAPETAPTPEPRLDRIGKLEQDLEDLKRQFEEFRKKFE